MTDVVRSRSSRSRSRGAGRVERAARLVLAVRRVRLMESDWLRLLSAAAVGAIGLALLVSAGLTDRYFHRGVSTGAERPYVYLPTGRELATNIDLRSYEGADLVSIATALETNGFRYVRQPFFWSEIEPSRDDWSWDRYDAIVAELSSREIEIVAVIRGTPEWARAADALGEVDGPPVDDEDFARFVGRLVGRYGETVEFFQIWDLPNRPDRWGGQAATPGDYAALVAAAHGAIQAVRPSALTVLAELERSPGSGALGDLAFLEGVYAAGAAPHFDVVAATIDGGGRSPYDRRVEPDRVNLSRVILFRELMEASGDAGTPIWGTRFGWEVGDPSGGVTADDQATFVLDALERARTEWPWLGLLFAWSFLPEPGSPGARYALLTVDADGTWRATQLFSDLVGAGGTLASVSGIGYVPTHAGSIGYTGRWQDQPLPPLVFRTTNELGATVRIAFEGTGLIATLRLGPNAGTIDAAVDGEPIPDWTSSSLRSIQASDLPLMIVSGLTEGRHELVLTLREGGELTIGGFVVVRELPFLWPVALLAGAGVALTALGIWLAAGVVAIRCGFLRRRRGEDVWLNVPELPRVPAVRRI